MIFRRLFTNLKNKTCLIEIFAQNYDLFLLVRHFMVAIINVFTNEYNYETNG